MMGGMPPTCYSIRLLADFVAYDAADCRTTNRSDSAAARQYRTCDATDASADRGVFVLCGHSRTTGQAENRHHHKRLNCKPLFRFHWNTSIYKATLKNSRPGMRQAPDKRPGYTPDNCVTA
jgi:hypothetical protein